MTPSSTWEATLRLRPSIIWPTSASSTTTDAGSTDLGPPERRTKKAATAISRATTTMTRPRVP